MNSLPSALIIMSHSLGWALLHSIWQGALIYITLRLVLKLIGNPSARLSYNLSFLALCGMFIWFLNTWAVNWNQLQQAAATQQNVQVIHTAGIWAGTTFYDNLVFQLERWLPFITILYITGIVLLAIRFIYNYATLQAYKKKGIIAATPPWTDKLEGYKEALQVSSNVRLLFSEYVTVPMVTGFIRPLILVPVAVVNQLSVEQLEAILIHELAHIKRNDYLLNMVQVFMETVLFFNPFVWMLSKVIRMEREHCCDDVVLDHTTHPLSYAHALTALETSRQTTLALAATGNKKLLLNRIKRIMDMKKNTIYSPAATIVLIIGIAVSLIWLTPVIAQTIKSNDKSKSKTTSTTTEKIIITDDNGKTRTYHSMKDIPAKDRAAIPAPPAPPKPGEAVIAPVPPVDIDPITPVPPVAPIAPIDISGITDSTIAVAMQAANEAIKSANISVEEANKALAAIDWKEINEEIAKAGKEVNAALKEIDWDEINKEIQQAQKEAAKAVKEANKAQKNAQKQSKKQSSKATW